MLPRTVKVTHSAGILAFVHENADHLRDPVIDSIENYNCSQVAVKGFAVCVQLSSLIVSA
jgi:hypothetical protein